MTGTSSVLSLNSWDDRDRRDEIVRRAIERWKGGNNESLTALALSEWRTATFGRSHFIGPCIADGGIILTDPTHAGSTRQLDKVFGVIPRVSRAFNGNKGRRTPLGAGGSRLLRCHKSADIG